MRSFTVLIPPPHSLTEAVENLYACLTRRVCVGFLSLGLVSISVFGGELYVSPTGDDAADGSASSPLASLECARDRLRLLRRTNGIDSGCMTVWLMDGIHVRTNAFVLTDEDSGSLSVPVVYRAVNRSRTILSGGARLAWRKPSAGDSWLSPLPSEARGKVWVAELPGVCPSFAGGGIRTRPPHNPFGVFSGRDRLPMARWPSDGSYEWLGMAPFRPAWTNDAACWFWTAPRVLWDDLRTSATNRDELVKLTSSSRYSVFNAISELNGPGQWVIDASGRRICLWPSGRLEDVVVASQERLVEGRGVRHVVFDGLVFAYARGTAVSLADSEDVVVRGCTIRQTMGDGVVVRGGHGCRVESCDLEDLGLGGVSLSGGVRETLRPSGHVVRNCHIRDYGRYEWNYRPGVSLAGVGARCENNLIHHARHQGIAFDGNDHYIGYNIVHDVCRGNEDSGAIYSYTDWDWASGRGTVIEYNLVHAVGTQPHGTFAFGIYVDGYSSGVRVRHNIVSQVEYGIFQSGGQDNVFEQNLIVSTLVPLTRRNYGLMSGKTPYHHVAAGRNSLLYRNLLNDRPIFETPVWKAHSPHLLDILAFDDPIWAQNSLHSTITNNVCVKSGACEFLDLDIMPGYYTITNNVEDADNPGFVDWKGFDWTFTPEGISALRLGPSRFRQMGLRADPARPSPAVRFGEGCTAPSADRLRPSARVRMDIVFSRTYSPTNPCAESPVCCDVPDWDAARRYVVADFGEAQMNGRWNSFAFSFVPRHDDIVTIDLVGGFGMKTFFDDIQVEGTTLVNGGFEDEGGWTWPKEASSSWPTSRLQSTDMSEPRGIVAAMDGVHPSNGVRMAAATEIFRVQQQVRVQAGKRVVVRFKACGGK